MELHMIRYDHRKHLEWLFEQMSSPKEQVMFIKNNNFNSIRDFDGWIQDNLKYFFTFLLTYHVLSVILSTTNKELTVLTKLKKERYSPPET